MYKNILLRPALLLTILFNSGCNKWLSLEPEDGIVRQEFWQTKEQVEAAVVGCYASLQDNPGGGTSIPEYLFLWGELRADMLSANVGVRATELEVMYTNILETNPICDWTPFYRTINYCNTVIELAPQVLETDETLTEAQLNAYVSEALALRSLMYFYLVRSFGDVPLKLDATLSDEQDLSLPKTERQVILDQIVKDLETAEQGALLSFADQKLNKGRITRYTVNAIQADVYLWMERYDECIAACNKVTGSGQFGLVSGDAGWFNTLYGRGNSSEGIFELQFDEQKLNPFYPMFSVSTGRRFLAAPYVIEELYGIDFDNPENKDIRGDGGAFRSGNSSVWKYLGLDEEMQRTQDESYAHWIFYRYAEILLFKAEALIQTGQGAEALELINTIRERAGALDITKREISPSDTQGLTDYLLQERAREFAYEGKRWYDVLRNAKRNNYQNLNLVIEMVSSNAPPDRQQSIANKYKDTYSHYFPIYIDELETNKNLEQNPFYLQ